jgi:hypothetical protein
MTFVSRLAYLVLVLAMLPALILLLRPDIVIKSPSQEL